MKPEKATPGTKVRLAGEFLRSTGQYTGGEGQSKWIIQECDCPMCSGNNKQFWVVAVNEPHTCQFDPTGYEDIPEKSRPKWRHINVANLETCP